MSDFHTHTVGCCYVAVENLYTFLGLLSPSSLDSNPLVIPEHQHFLHFYEELTTLIGTVHKYAMYMVEYNRQHRKTCVCQCTFRFLQFFLKGTGIINLKGC